jgi:hypothetical protein
MIMSDTEKIKELKDNLTKKKLDIIQTLAENDSIYHPEIILRLVWELRSIIKTLNWIEQ